MRQCGLDQTEGRLHVDIERFLKKLVGAVLERYLRTDSRVVDQDIDAAKVLDGRFDPASPA